ncbi:MFS transporter [Lysobacter soli]|uniref:MFS transporter n=1 Tax=Lysobacter soli TaxID=453783 RepID=UPI0037C5E644
MNASVAAAPPSHPMPTIGRAVPTALAGAFFVNLANQFTATNLADIQGSLGASADEASWIATIYTMTSFVGIVLSPILVRTFGLRRYFASAAAVFAATAWLAFAATSLPTMIVARALQGVAGGSFGPIAFVAVFALWKGPRATGGLALLAAALLVPVNAGPIVSAFVEASFGWRALFLLQAVLAAALLCAGLAWMPAAPVNRDALKTHWPAVALLASALASLVLVLSQGTRRFWLEDDVIAMATSVSIGAWVGFAVLNRYATPRILDTKLLAGRDFGLPILLNLIFRASFAVTVYLIPLLLALTQGYRPEQTAQALWWCVLSQLAVFPLVWQLLARTDGRRVALGGLLLCAIGTLLAAFSTNLAAGEQLRASLMFVGVGQMMFLVPTLLSGASALGPADGPTATVAFNATTLGGTTLGTGLMSHFVTEREKFHSSVLVEQVSWLGSASSDRLSSLASALDARWGEQDANVARAIAQLGSVVRREAWLLSIDDAFLVVGAVLLVSLCLVAFMRPAVIRPSLAGETP